MRNWISGIFFERLRISANALVVLLSIVVSFSSQHSHAQNHKGISFQGVVKLPSGEFPTRSGLTVNARILSPNNCILREEQFTGVNISNGYVNISIGTGTVGGYDPGLTMSQAMDNSKVVPGLVCLNLDGSVSGSVTSFNPSVTNGARKFRLSVTIDSTLVEADFNMRAMAFAVNAESLNGKVETDFVNTSSNITQSNVESWFASTVLPQLLAGTYVASSATTAVTATNVSGTVGIANGGTGAATASAALTNLLPAQAGNSGKVLSTDGSAVSWVPIASAPVSSVAGRTGDVTLSSADLSDFNSAMDARLASSSFDASQITTGTLSSSVLPVSAKAWVDGGSGILYYNSGNVGIGTLSPSEKLEVAGQVKITGGSPGAGKVLTSDAAGLASWQSLPAGNAGTVTNVSSGNNYITITNGSSSAVVTANVGTTVDTLAAGNDARFSDARTPSGGASGDLSGNYPSPTVAKINGNAVASTIPTAGQVMVWSAGQYAPANFGVGHLLSATGAQQFANASCSSSQTLTWSSLTDTFSCSTISGLDASVLNGGTIADARLPASATTWVDGGSGIRYYNGGYVGVGTTFPLEKMEIAGNLFMHQAAGDSGIRLQHGSGTSYWVSTPGDNMMSIGGVGATVPDSGVINIVGPNMGVGTVNPAAKLDVNGYIRTGSDNSPSASVLLVDNYVSGNLTTLGTERSSGAPVLGYSVIPDVSVGGFLSSTPIYASRGAITVGGSSNGIRFFQGPLQTVAVGDPVSMTEVMRITSAGKVGIGTTAPAEKFEVTGIDYLNGTSVVGGIRVNGALNDFGGLAIWDRDGSSATTNDGDTTLYFGDDVEDNLRFGYKGSGLAMVELMRLTSGGNFGIGTSSPATKLQVAGEISPSADNTYPLGNTTRRFTAVYAVNGTVQTSDARQKTNIQNSELGLDFINHLRPVSYNWKSGPDSEVHYGLIAQETEKTVNDFRQPSSLEKKTPIVDYDEKSDRYGLRYTELISPIIKAIQELYAKFDSQSLESNVRIKELENENAQLKKDNAAIKEYLCAKDPGASLCY